jgi:hypothetical protein
VKEGELAGVGGFEQTAILPKNRSTVTFFAQAVRVAGKNKLEARFREVSLSAGTLDYDEIRALNP